jgi:hypothetical protein
VSACVLPISLLFLSACEYASKAEGLEKVMTLATFSCSKVPSSEEFTVLSCRIVRRFVTV